MTIFDDPNREAVGLDPAWVEGTGGGEPEVVEPVEPIKDTKPVPEPEPPPADDET